MAKLRTHAAPTRKPDGGPHRSPGGNPARNTNPALFARISPARAAAFEVLEQVAISSAHSDDLLHGPRLAGLSQVDRDLTMTLVLGVLRWQIALDARLRPLLSRPDLQVAEPVAFALRLGAFQLLHLERIPPHAALNESVELVRAAGHPHAAGMVNALLRKLSGASALRKPLVESAEAMADRVGHPLWLVQRWLKNYGRAAAADICAFDQEPPSGDSLFAANEGEPSMPRIDAGSRLVAELAAASRPDAQRVWDCCAAPGGKTMVLAQRLPEAALLATDTNPERLRRLEQRLARELPTRPVEVMAMNAAAPPESAGLFDLILCDVPCSGTGTLARNPEIRHRLQPADLRRQAERQESILHGAMRRLAPGGRLLYSTCSLEPEENQAVVDAVLAGGTAAVYRRVPVDAGLDRLRSLGGLTANATDAQAWVKDGCLRTLPGHGFAGDGFFAALVERAPL